MTLTNSSQLRVSRGFKVRSSSTVDTVSPSGQEEECSGLHFPGGFGGYLSGLGLTGSSQNVPEIAFPPRPALWEM